MRPSVQCTGSVSVPTSADAALHLFTPEGERRWVPGWAPEYPAGGRPDPAAGVVFLVGKQEGMSCWVVTRFDPRAGFASYAYTLPGRRVAVVEVVVEPTGQDRCRADVTYRMTSLAPEGDAFVAGFPDDFAAMLRTWEDDIRRHLLDGASHRPPHASG